MCIDAYVHTAVDAHVVHNTRHFQHKELILVGDYICFDSQQSSHSPYNCQRYFRQTRFDKWH